MIKGEDFFVFNAKRHNRPPIPDEEVEVIVRAVYDKSRRVWIDRSGHVLDPQPTEWRYRRDTTLQEMIHRLRRRVAEKEKSEQS
jgi:hypothetical protein